MRTLFLLRGIPASGKTSWIQQNNLEPYTLSTDGIRLLYQSPVTTNDGEFAISQDNDKAVWDLLYDLLERRMEKGEFVIVDATHYKSSILSKYKDYISKYRYRAYVVDFTYKGKNIPKSEMKLSDKDELLWLIGSIDEIGKLESLRQVIEDVQQAIKNKTDEFGNEATAVDGFVNSEI